MTNKKAKPIPSRRNRRADKKGRKIDLFLLPGIPTDNDLEDLADALLAGGRGQNREQPKRASSLSEDSPDSEKAKDRGSDVRSRPRSPGSRRSSGGGGRR